MKRENKILSPLIIPSIDQRYLWKHYDWFGIGASDAADVGESEGASCQILTAEFALRSEFVQAVEFRSDLQHRLGLNVLDVGDDEALWCVHGQPQIVARLVDEAGDICVDAAVEDGILFESQGGRFEDDREVTQFHSPLLCDALEFFPEGG